MIKNLLELGPVQGLLEHFYALSERDQLALKVLSSFLVLIFLVLWAIMPAAAYNAKAQQRYGASLEDLNWIKANQSLASAAAQQRSKRDPGQSLLGVANTTSKSYRLSFKRYQPVGENGLSLWLNQVSFNDVVLWLERLDKRYGISVQEISVDRVKSSNLVNIRLVLQG